MDDIPKSYKSPYFIIDAEVSHEDQAKENNIWQFKGQENIEKLIEVLLGPLQDVQRDILITQKGLSIEQGTDWLLDLVAKSLQVYRGVDQDDESFRRAIVQKILEDSSQGTINDVLAAFEKFVDEGVYISLIEAHPASAIIQVPLESLDITQNPLTVLDNSLSAGVSGHIHVHDETSTQVFSFDPSEGGFSSSSGGDQNGSLSAVLKQLDNTLEPFRLDIQQGASSGLSATDALNQGQLVDLASYVDTTGDGIPDSPAIIRIEAKNYEPQ